MELIAPCHFGLEAVLKRELEDEGWEILQVDDGRVMFRGDEYTAAMANIRLRTAERVLIRVGEFEAKTYDALFEGTKALPLEDYLSEDARFWVTKASSVKSKLFSPSDIQSVMKKAMVERMKIRYNRKHFPEDGAPYPFRVSLKKDMVTVGLDMSGPSLHKRGYRVSPVIAPISETLAAAIILLSPWKPGRFLVDPFCGSGTIPIEAAMMAKHIAPGLNRHFTAEEWPQIIDPKVWREVREEAKSEIISDHDIGTRLIQGYDIDRNAVKYARDNAKAAGVEGMIHFQERAVKDLSHPGRYGFIITNPPYGERISDRAELPALYAQIGEAYRGLKDWSMFLITAYEDAEKYIGRRAAKNRKIYNGMLKTYLYQYMGPKPGQ
ncbi:MAG: class I SAM-dependent RNA methyltransferase [Lachnospiraceae bacterium]|nr:class I SAM-dependent RNA methyltransferase [Lachnospiraceae bacterium]